MKIQEHCASSLKRFGKYYRPLHELLDWYCERRGIEHGEQYDYTGAKSYRHKEKLHHREFVGLIRDVYGNEMADAATLHIQQDFEGTRFEKMIPQKYDYKYWGLMLKKE